MDNALDLLLGTYPSWSRAVVRVALGVVFLAHGGQKVFGWFGGPGLKATIQTFQQYMQVPPAATVMAALVELLGGLALLAGFLARPAAVGLIAVMLVAVAKVHARNGFFINFANTPGKGHGFEFNFALIAMALSILVGGAGALSIDCLLRSLGD
ncbi:MAG TPA: DoxX family protein [Candidatus Binatia bacterium]|nr:DoxX family protein [Candidatus Binatia bacterium]